MTRAPWALLAALPLLSCVSQKAFDKLNESLSTLEVLHRDLDHRHSRELAWLTSRIGCTEDLKSVIKEVTGICSQRQVCRGRLVNASFKELDPSSRHKNILSPLMHLQHRAFYFTEKDKLQGNSDEIDLMLKTLLTAPHTRSTQYLVLTHEDPPPPSPPLKGRGRAGSTPPPLRVERSDEKRSAEVIKRMMNIPQVNLPTNNSQGDLMVLPWIVDFSVQGEEINDRDRRIPDTVKKVDKWGDLRTSVWVFRVDC